MTDARAERRLRRAEDAGSVWDVQRERVRIGLCPWCGVRDELGSAPMRDAGSGLRTCWRCYLRRGIKEAITFAAEAAVRSSSSSNPSDPSLTRSFGCSFTQTLFLSMRVSVMGKRWPALSSGGWKNGVLPATLSHRDSAGLIAAGFGFRSGLAQFSSNFGNEHLGEAWPILAPIHEMHEGCHVAISGTRRLATTKNLRERLRDWADVEPRLNPSDPRRIDDIRLKAPKAAWKRWLDEERRTGKSGAEEWV